MSTPIAVFGSTNQDFTQKVIELRKEFFNNGFYKEEGDQLLTVPHLTLCVNKDFDMQKMDDLKAFLLDNTKNQKKFSIKVNDFIIMQNNIAASFDNSYTQQVARNITAPLGSLGFEIVITDHMRLIRSEVKDEFLEEVRKVVDERLPKEIKIENITIAGKLLRFEDVLWEVELQD